MSGYTNLSFMIMKGEVVTVVRLPIFEIAGVVAEHNNITVPLTPSRSSGSESNVQCW